MAGTTTMARAGRVLRPLLLLAASVALAIQWRSLTGALGLDPAGAVARHGQSVVETAAWIAAAFCLIRLLDAVLWRGIVERRRGTPVPRLLGDLVAGMIWVVAAMVVLAQVLDQPVAGLVTTSGVAIAVIGFALRDIIASLFSGIAINLERPYQIGDWIEVEPGVVGKVQEVGWLTTRTVTRDGIGVVVPNARLASAPFRNYDLPDASWRDSFAITLDHGLATERVERILLAAMKAVPEVARAGRPPDVKIDAVTDWGIRWLARYWVGDYGRMPEIRHAVQKSVLHHLHHAGIAIPYPRRDVFLGRMGERALDQRRHLDMILARNELFADLAPPDLRQLAERAERHDCRAGLPIVRLGDPGASLFVIVEGLLEVRRPGPDGVERRVDEMVPGAAFGEFSLLTGEPRSATVVADGDAVVYEITKEDLQPVLERRPDLAGRLARILDDRQLQRRREGELADAARPATATPNLWLERVRTFFGLEREPGAADVDADEGRPDMPASCSAADRSD